MSLTKATRYEVEQLIVDQRRDEAIQRFRDATGTGARGAARAIDRIAADLYARKPWMFQEPPQRPPSTRLLSKPAILLFLVFDLVLFAGVMYWFFAPDALPGPAAPPQQVGDRYTGEPASSPTAITTRSPAIALAGRQGDAVALPVPDPATYMAALRSEDTFASLYADKLADSGYVARKSDPSRSRGVDRSPVEQRIKALRSRAASARVAPSDDAVIAIPRVAQAPRIDGRLEQREWERAVALQLEEAPATTLYLVSDGEWLFVGCDARDETTAGGYDQLRVYLHAGLLPGLVNERVHLGRGEGVTTIRQTTMRWTGPPPGRDEERWKRFDISDWGIYRYAIGKSHLQGHRQYEMAVHLGEAGIASDAPFTLFAEVETDPQRDAHGGFEARRYLGRFGSQEAPLWMGLATPVRDDPSG